MTKGLQSTLNLLNLRPSEIKRAQEVVPGGNRPDLLVGGGTTRTEELPAPAPVPVPNEIGRTAGSERPLPKPPVSRVIPGARPPRDRQRNAGKPKFSSLARIEARFRDDQIDFLTDLEIQLRRRDLREERLTKASIIRAVVDILPHINLDMATISDEDSLRTQLLNNLGIPKNKPSQASPKPIKIA